MEASEDVYLCQDDILSGFFTQFGSDKTANGYDRIYASLLRGWGEGEGKCLLEIGLGTNDPKAISSMGRHGRPGASLRAFSKRFPAAKIFGADVDRRILFDENNIQTSFVDQLSTETFFDMHKRFEGPIYDVIIDDGLHCPLANINSLLFFLSVSRPGAVFVAEDIPDRTLDVWRVVSVFLKLRGYECRLIKTRKSNVVVVVASGS